PGARFVSLEEQTKLPFGLARLLPTGHYVRKNLAYLLAVAGGAGCVYETDDDNEPLGHWAPRSQTVDARVADAKGWYNVYRVFSDAHVWPRGFPLDKTRDRVAPPSTQLARRESPIQQGLTD